MIPFLDVEYPLDEADKDATVEELRRMAAKQLTAWQERLDRINDLYEKINEEYNKISRLRSHTQRMLVSAEIFIDMVNELFEVSS